MSLGRAAGLTMTLVLKPIPSFRSTEVHSASVFQEGKKKLAKRWKEKKSHLTWMIKKKKKKDMYQRGRESRATVRPAVKHPPWVWPLGKLRRAGRHTGCKPPGP